MLYEGVSIGELSEIFRYDKRKVSSLLGGLQPCGKRHGYPVYDLAEAASRLARPTDEQIIDVLQRLPVNRLPVHLQKEFWDAQRSRQAYEENAKDLWRTDQVFEALVEVFRTVKTSAVLFVDAVERETELTAKQREVIMQLVDDLLADIHSRSVGNPKFEKLVSRFEQQDHLPEIDIDGSAESETEEDSASDADEFGL